MLRTIPKRELALGMFVVMYGRGTDTSPIVFANRRVESERTLRRLLELDVDEFSVDESLFRAVDAPPPPPELSPEQERRARELAQELPEAERLHAEAMAQVRRFMDEVRRGRCVDFREALPVVEGIVESVLRNEAAAAAMFKLKRFDEYSYTHCLNVATLAVVLGKHLGLQRETLRGLGLAGLFHDVGKARLPEDIVNKPARLTAQEFQVMKSHAVESYHILSEQKDMPREALRGVLEHHERYDGSGYPRGLRREDIGPVARVLSVVDVYDALTSKRCYRDAVSASRALRMMYQWRETTFPPQSIENFIKCIGVYPVGSFVRLTGGEYGVVACTNAATSTLPVVKVVLDAALNRRQPRLVDLAAQKSAGERMEILECLSPAAFPMDLGALLMA